MDKKNKQLEYINPNAIPFKKKNVKTELASAMSFGLRGVYCLAIAYLGISIINFLAFGFKLGSLTP
jgi:hypothetical protein